MKVLIIEDEKLGFDNLRRGLKHIDSNVSIDGPVKNVVDMRTYMLCQQKYDVIFSDIKLEDGVCFEALSDVEVTTPMVFITAYDEYALKAFETGGISYLLKPIDQEQLGKAVERAMQMKRGCQNLDLMMQYYAIPTNGQYAKRLLVNSYDGANILAVADINHIAFEEGKIVAYTNQGKVLTLSEKTLDSIATRLDPSLFFRANRQYIIHIGSIKKIHTWFRQTEVVEMQHYQDLRINISKEKVPEFHAWIEQG